MQKLLLLLVLSASLISCVTQKEYSKALDDYLNEAVKNKYLQLKLDSVRQENIASQQQLQDKITQLRQDSATLSVEMAKQQAQITDMEDKFQSAQISFMKQLQQASSSNQKSNAELLQMQLDLEKQKLALDAKQATLNKLTEDVALRETRIQELEKLLNEKNEKTQQLQLAVQQALSGFNAGELSVYQKDGKVYVSMSDNLLFKSASVKVEAKGEEALGKLAEIIQKNPDLNIMVEGHTDNVPYKSNNSCMKDNWDLSLMRSSSVVHILTEKFKVNPVQLIASGRGEFYPVSSNTTTEGKAQNRRTEIILTPNLDKLNQLLNAGK